MAIPWSAWETVGWSGIALVVAVLLFRRHPMVFALRRWLDPLDGRRDAAFVGWFGPIGVAAVFYASLAVRRTGYRAVWTVASLIVAGSIIAHGATATPLTLWFREGTDRE